MKLTRRAALMGVGVAVLAPHAILAQDIGVAGLVEQVSGSNLRDHVFGLSALPTRWTSHAGFGEVELWMLNAMGAGAFRQPFEMPDGKTRHNILVADPADPRDMVIVGAHFDSISERPDQRAPGADDNATGVAAMLEALRILGPLTLERQIVFMGFAGEEQGLIGSRAAARAAADWPVHMMLNLDMLGYRPTRADAPMVIEYDQGNAVPGNNATARSFARTAARLAAEHTSLATIHTDIWASDYMPFEAHGVPCIGLFDGGTEGGHYHTTQDTPEHVDFGRLEQATRLAVAILANAAGVTG